MKQSSDPEFDRFWEQYPRRIGKLAAHQQFRRALKIASLEDILAGVERYKANKPEYADWCHPKTWLHQGRWMDEYATPVRAAAWTCPHVTRCSNREQCQNATILGRPVKAAS